MFMINNFSKINLFPSLIEPKWTKQRVQDCTVISSESSTLRIVITLIKASVRCESVAWSRDVITSAFWPITALSSLISSWSQRAARPRAPDSIRRRLPDPEFWRRLAYLAALLASPPLPTPPPPPHQRIPTIFGVYLINGLCINGIKDNLPFLDTPVPLYVPCNYVICNTPLAGRV